MLQILAPCDGWCGPLDEVPDPVFAGRMLGDGVAIDPTSPVLLAPCAGEIIALPASAHAVSIRTAQGIDLRADIAAPAQALGEVHAAIRRRVPRMDIDREVAGQIAVVNELLPDLVTTSATASLLSWSTGAFIN